MKFLTPLKKNLLLWLLLLLPAILFADPSVPGRSGIPAIDTLPLHEWDEPPPRGNNPWIALPLAALTPGGGHYYTGRYVRGGFLSAIQLYLASEIFINYDLRSDKHREKAESALANIVPLVDSLARASGSSSLTTVWRDSLKQELSDYRYSNDMLMEERGLHQSHIAWMIGLQLYGLMDTWNILRHSAGRSHDLRPLGSTVAWAIFLPGSGQIRNDEWGKAGLLYMSLIGSFVSFNARQDCVSWYLQRLQVARSEGDSDEISYLEEKLSFFRKKRNQYVWAPILFYLYSIADAAVDAILSDFDNSQNFTMQPELNPYEESLGISLAWNF